MNNTRISTTHSIISSFVLNVVKQLLMISQKKTGNATDDSINGLVIHPIKVQSMLLNLGIAVFFSHCC